MGYYLLLLLSRTSAAGVVGVGVIPGAENTKSQKQPATSSQFSVLRALSRSVLRTSNRFPGPQTGYLGPPRARCDAPPHGPHRDRDRDVELRAASCDRTEVSPTTPTCYMGLGLGLACTTPLFSSFQRTAHLCTGRPRSRSWLMARDVERRAQSENNAVRVRVPPQADADA